MLVTIERTEQVARLSLVPFLLSSRLASRVVGAASFLLPVLSISSLERWYLHSFPYRSGLRGLGGRSPLRRKVPSECESPILALGYLTASTSLLSQGKEGKRKIKLGLRSIDLPDISWLGEIASHFQSQRERFNHFSFSAETQGEELWLGGKARKELPIRQRNMI